MIPPTPPTTAHSAPTRSSELVFSTPTYTATVEVLPGAESPSFVVRHRHYHVIAAAFHTIHEAIIACKMMEEITVKVLSRTHLSAEEMIGGESQSMPTAKPPRLN